MLNISHICVFIAVIVVAVFCSLSICHAQLICTHLKLFSACGCARVAPLSFVSLQQRCHHLPPPTPNHCLCQHTYIVGISISSYCNAVRICVTNRLIAFAVSSSRDNPHQCQFHSYFFLLSCSCLSSMNAHNNSGVCVCVCVLQRRHLLGVGEINSMGHWRRQRQR